VKGWSRRQVVQGAGAVGLGLLAGCGRLPGQAQPAERVYRVGLITLGSPTAAAVASAVDSFRHGMLDQGYIEGRNLVIEPRFAEGSAERLPALVEELARLPVDVLVVTSSPSVRAAQAATRTIPIVAAIGGDLVEAGYVASLSRPGGNITGMSDPTAGLSGKRLQLLKEAVPAVSRVALPWNTASLPHAAAFADTQRAAGILGLQIIALEVSGSNPDFEAAFETAVAEGADALLALPSDIIAGNSGRIVALANKYRLPSMFPLPLFVAAGGLMAYGPSHVAMHRRAAYFVNRILSGTQPADLPVEQPTTFDFVINLRTVQALGLTIPHHVLLQATEVIQ
jgi:putative tryptophan/tyrosine transport system substrate-binding protein